MSIRLPGLSSIDPLSVPLPSGTEVTTRVTRVAPDGERHVPEGAVGRVIGARDGGFEVNLPGVGVLFYAREELVPRKVGQLRYALRREAAWSELRGCVVLEAVVGSRAWGLAEAGSDTDERGAFVLPLPWTLGLAEPPRDLVSSDGSATFWESGKMVRQALRADPNTLELLFVDGVRALDPLGEWILEARDAFVSAEIYGTFGRYALSQLGKLERTQRLAEHREVVLGWLIEEPQPSLDEIARRLAAISPRPAPTEADGLLAAREYIKQLYRSLFDQGLIAANDYGALVAYARAGGAAPTEARQLRPKNAYNLLRLIAAATEWLRTGVPQLEVRGPLRERLLSIKHGEVPLDEVAREAEAMTGDLEAARQVTRLPPGPDLPRADALLRRLGEEVARRWVTQAPGVFGRDAPPSPPFTDEE